ncbi:MAG TPA: GntR family transcriptional regulator [Jatrophihabitans sp.]
MTERSPDLLRDVIADDIRTRIVSGLIKPGRRIREDEVAADHGVSRVPVREALQKLEAEGFLTLTPYRGATVSVPSPELALRAMEVRRALEVMAARLAARVRGGASASQLEKVMEKGNRAVAAKRFSQIPELVTQFHELVAVASGNPEIVELLALYRGKVDWMFSHDLEHRAEGEWDDHAAILDAILDGNEDRAGDRMDGHVLKDETAARQAMRAGAAEDAARTCSTKNGGA